MFLIAEIKFIKAYPSIMENQTQYQQIPLWKRLVLNNRYVF